MKILSAREVREAEEYTLQADGITVRTLIERAAAALAAAVRLRADYGAKICFVCGEGNNGADGITAAEYLTEFSPAVVRVADGGDGLRKFIESVADYDIIVDAVFGTGLNRMIEGTLCGVIAAINGSRAFVISADIPSGLNADTGDIMGVCVDADLTVGFGVLKRGHLFLYGRDMCGETVCADIGLKFPHENYPEVLTDFTVPGRKSKSNKGDYANVKIIAGSRRMPGAAVLSMRAAESALRSGAGLVTLGVPQSVLPAYAARTVESMLFPLSDGPGGLVFAEQEIRAFLEKADVLIIGSGLGRNQEIALLLEFVLREYALKVIIDADGLNMLREEMLPGSRCNIVLTPHVAEFSRLSGYGVYDVERNMIDLAREYAARNACTVVLKSNTTVITDGERVRVYAAGSAALAKGGSGDVLAGITGGLSAFMPLTSAAEAACGILAECAAAYPDYSVHSITASDLIKKIPYILKKHVK
ncbi:MAG: NAD(P)H-hydrate dehydratase [Clostridiales bacterium]|jgi:NAD(P)H-hydrate epimerase|nr:NAD(P)H-hydrate dehydratase [Clostridiales bacterium]